ncbi:sodium- and chloride-dependent transporter XTRP3A-like [Styela clava]
MTKKGSEQADERPQWDNKAQFLLTCVGFAVGLGNIWRFPYILQKNGGGAFLIPYFIMLFVEGIPLLYLELAGGQLLRAGSIGVWRKISPYIGGIGICSMFVSFLIGVYYNTIIAWCLWYIFNSFQEPLPWKNCPPNSNLTAYVTECAKSSPSQYFWYRDTLNITPAIDISGGIQVHLLACLIMAWVIVYLCISKGIASSGKVVYFTATFPYFVLVIFLGRGLSLEGAGTGVNYLFSADFSQLSNPSIWLSAATQIFFSLSLAFGGMIAFSSYNPRDNNCERDTLIVAFINSGTSILASVVVFSVLGFKATVEWKECVNDNIETILDSREMPEGSINVDSYDVYVGNNDVSDLNLTSCVVEDFLDTSASGAGLAFIVIADAIVNMPGSQFWSILWFMMLFCLGIDSMFGTMEGLITPLYDIGISKKLKQIYMISIVISISFLISLTFVQGSGNYWLDIFDTYAGSLPLLVIAFFELIAVGWVFKYRKFEKAVDEMIGEQKNWFRIGLRYYWWAMIPVISPIVLVAVFIGYLYEKFSSENTYSAWIADEGANVPKEYPPGAVAVSAIIAISCTIWIPVVAAVKFVQNRYFNNEPEIGNTAMTRYNPNSTGGVDNAVFDGKEGDTEANKA